MLFDNEEHPDAKAIGDIPKIGFIKITAMEPSQGGHGIKN